MLGHFSLLPGAGDPEGSRRPRAEARPTGRAISRERLGDWDGPMAT
jgi:hypothetical protein